MSTKDFINKDKAEGGAKILHWVAQYVESNRDSTTSQDANLKGFMLKGEILAPCLRTKLRQCSKASPLSAACFTRWTQLTLVEGAIPDQIYHYKLEHAGFC